MIHQPSFFTAKLLHLSFWLLSAHIAVPAATIPGKFYGYDVVAKNGQSGLTGMGSQPSINDHGQVAFIGQSAGGESIWVGDGLSTPRNINPGSVNPGRLFFGAGLQINNQNKVAAQDRLNSTLAPSSNLRIWDAAATDSFVNGVRAGTGQPFDAIFGFTSINESGVATAGALTGVTRLLVRSSSAPLLQFLITSPSPQPMIADDGRVVIRLGTPPAVQIRLYDANFLTFVTIANQPNFSSLDNAPGISDDGRIIAFKGDLTAVGAAALGTTPGPGIFASIDEGGGIRKVIRVTGRQVEDVSAIGPDNDGECEPGETCKPAADLGYNDSDSIITFASYAPDARISVSNVDFGGPGIADDTFRISFLATPSSASRSNPAAGGKPLLFSDKLGLWTIRVDVNNELVIPRLRVYNVQTAIPVAQIGDRIDGATLTAIGVGFSIGQAATTDSIVTTFRTMRRGDHRAVFWADTTAGHMIIKASHLDSDYDGLLDIWETTGIDMDQDGIADLNLAAMGATIGKRDLFLQFDFLADGNGFSFGLAPGVTQPLPGRGSQSELELMLQIAPALSGPMHGVRADGAAPSDVSAGILPHFDAGSGFDSLGAPLSRNMGTGALLGGNRFGMPGAPTSSPDLLYFGKPGSVAIPGLDARSFQEIKNGFFNFSEKKARELAFHYTIMGTFSDLARNITTNQPLVFSAAPPFASDLVSAKEGIPSDVVTGDWVKVITGTGTSLVPIRGRLPSDPRVLVIECCLTLDATSKFVILDGASGNSEVKWYASPNNHALPSNDFIISFRGYGRNTNGTPATACIQWRTIAHELGHTLGLRHGGTDFQSDKGPLYFSLMSYSYQLKCTPRSPVQSYSSILDPTFDDYSNLRMDFLNSQIHLGNSIAEGFGEGKPFDLIGSPSEQNLADYNLSNGPIDLVAPSVSITGPLSIAVGSVASVQLSASDAFGITSVVASLDVNGNGVIDPTETVNATANGPGRYLASFGAVSGIAGTRIITAFAIDPSMNAAKANANVAVSSIGGITAGPVPVSLSPVASTGLTATYTFTFSDGAGFQNLDVVNVLINRALDGANACYLAYSQPASILYLVNDPGPANGLSAGLTLGGSGSISNSQCTINAAGSSASGIGNNLILTLNITFKAAFLGNKVIYLAARSAAANSGWQTRGARGVPPLPTANPAPVSMSPASGGTATQTLAFTYRDASSAANLQTMWTLMNTALDARQACYTAYFQPGNLLFLYPDNGDGAQATSMVLTGNSTLSNSQCTISAQGSSVVQTGAQTVVNLNITFKPGFAGSKGVWLANQNLVGATSPWEVLGNWIVP